MLHINFNAPFPILETENLVLRRPALSDVDELFLYRSDREFMRFIMHRLATCREDVVTSIQTVNGIIDRNEAINWAITRKGNDMIIGMLGYVQINKGHARAEIGYTMHRPYHGTGIIQEATKAVIDYGFNVMNLHSIEAVIVHENIPSKKLVERFGFTCDAFFKDYLFQDGRFVDTNVYSLIRS
jgi:ribosomal-protein-alanine N-acetyltransferase